MKWVLTFSLSVPLPSSLPANAKKYHPSNTAQLDKAGTQSTRKDRGRRRATIFYRREKFRIFQRRKLYIIRRAAYFCQHLKKTAERRGKPPFFTVLPITTAILPIRKQQQHRRKPHFFAYFAYFAPKLFRTRKKNIRANFILPIFAAKWAKF